MRVTAAGRSVVAMIDDGNHGVIPDREGRYPGARPVPVPPVSGPGGRS
jgi:hypothetical protein